MQEAPGKRWALEGRFLCRLCVTVRKKPGTLLGVGKRLVLGVGFASPLPFLPLGQGWTEGRGGKMGVSAPPAPGTPSFAPWDVGVDHEPERVPKAWKSFPPEGGGEVAA